MTTIECPVKNSSNKFPNNTALSKGELQISYKELSNRIEAAVLSLKGKGVRPGMKVGLISENSIEYIILIFALLRMGSLAVPISFRFRYKEIKEIISGMGIDLVISDMFTDYLDNSGTDRIGLNNTAAESGVNEGKAEKMSLKYGGTIILTSGSTGVPKGVLISVENHYYSAIGSNLNIDLKIGDKWLLILPLYHVGGLAILFRVFLAGATITLPEGNGKSMCKEIEDGDITHVSMVSTQLVEYVSGLESKNKTAPPILKVVLAGGSYIPESHILRALSLDIPVYKTYGLTEMSSQVTATEKKVSKNCITTSGSLLKYRDLLIGTGNEILVRGKTLSRGYISEGKFISLKTDEGGWFNTGDLGNIGESGDLFLSGRKDNMFISGGENVFPEEIESELLKLERIIEAVVVSIEDEKYGKRPVAFISTGGEKISKRKILASLKARLPGYKVPDKFYYLESIKPGEVKRRRPYLEELAKIGKGLKTISD